ncbi:probable auxin efflux carrier component 5a [Miscanthus floridulus]|uniref:probable auxin efflux carrier component 5a n=1 Tax=Miscanthus floridulus TaxID=154761 RepID=UPI00345800FE
MISWDDMYKWWKISTPELCESVNSLVALFAIPFFTFRFTVHIDPFRANYRAIAADVVSKVVIGARWVLFARGHCNAAVNWSITGFSLSTLTSSLVVGVPMAQAMYGDWVQLSIFQAIV